MKESLFTLFLFLMIGTSGFACSCIGESDIRQEVRSTDYIFKGKVVSIEVITIENEEFPNLKFSQQKVTIELEKKYKGRLSKNMKITLFTGMGGGDCGFKFNLDQSYIVYADKIKEGFRLNEGRGKILGTNICKRTTSDIEGETKELAGIFKRKG